ncbi:MAG TPA: trigger factor [Candidatus Paceibacterota bacterium]
MSEYTIKKTTNLEKECAKELELEISVETLNSAKIKTLKRIGAKADIQGFRKGHVPEKAVMEKLGEAGVLEETINDWLNDNIVKILEKEAPEAIAFPKITIKKAVPGNPVELSLFISLRPKLTLPDYKTIASAKNKKKSPEEKVEEKEIDEAILRLRKYAYRAVNPNAEKEIKDEELPALTDEFAVSVGGGKTVAELRERVSKDLLEEKKTKAKEKQRLEIIEEILKKTDGILPAIIIDDEVDKMEAEFEADVKRMGLSFDDYVKSTKKTIEEIRKDWRGTAEKRAKVNLILAEIRKLEKIEADKEKVDHEMKHLLEHHKDIDQKNARAYIERMLGNEKVFEFLGNQ